MRNKKLLIDTHAHVNFKDFKDDAKNVVKKALDENVWMINVGSERKTSERAVKMAEKYEEGVYAAVGLHPSHLIEQEFDYDFYLNLAKNKKVVGIGECGLDYFRIADKNFKQKQKEVFVKQLKLAREADKPIIIHCRDAHNDLLEIISLEDGLPRGVMHFFTGTLEQAKKYIDLGFYISFSGVITFTDTYDEVVKNVPLEKMLIETDCPYVAPVPHRGKRNEPQYVKYVAQKIAELRGLTFEEVVAQTTQNARNLFKI